MPLAGCNGRPQFDRYFGATRTWRGAHDMGPTLSGRTRHGVASLAREAAHVARPDQGPSLVLSCSAFTPFRSMINIMAYVPILVMTVFWASTLRSSYTPR
ncbi:unnamed protein product [Sphagnum balticum]